MTKGAKDMKLREPASCRTGEVGGMRSRIVDDGSGDWTLVDNLSYRGRSASRIERLFADGS